MIFDVPRHCPSNHTLTVAQMTSSRSHCGVVDKPLALYTRGGRFDSRLHQSVE